MGVHVRSVLLCTWLAMGGAQAWPSHTGYVNDFAHLLSDDSRSSLEALLRETADQTTAEIAVATVTSLDGLSVEEYATKLFDAWGVGKKQVDNGVLVLVAPQERKVRIEVGYGLEPVLPDGLAGEVIRTNILPHFRNDDYARGIDEGVRRVVDIVRRKHVLTAVERDALAEQEADRPPMWLITPFFGVFVGIGFFMVGAGLGSKTGFPVLFGSFFGGMPLLMSLIPFFNSALWVLGPLAVAMVILGYRKGRASPSTWRTSGRGSSRGSWQMGGSSGGGSRSSGGSSSGSSFGGGRSGGGGASGSW